MIRNNNNFNEKSAIIVAQIVLKNNKLKCSANTTKYFKFNYAQKDCAGFPAFLPSDFLFHLASNLFNQILKNNNNFNE